MQTPKKKRTKTIIKKEIEKKELQNSALEKIIRNLKDNVPKKYNK